MEMPPGPPLPGPASPPPAPVPGAEPTPPVESPPPPGLLADEAANRRLVATVAALALVAVALMIGVFLLTRDGDDGAAAPVLDPLPTGTTAVPQPAEAAIDPAELDALVAELQAVVEAERGLEFREPVDIELLAEAAYLDRSRADFEEDLAEDPDDLDHAAAALGALGLWPAGVDPAEVLGEYLSVGSLGYYDPETGEMVVRGAADTPNLRITLVHELTHALDDQHFELDRPDLDDRPDEAGFAFTALVEGSASRVEAAYTASLTDEERADAEAEQRGYVDGIDLSAFPQILLAQQQFVYGTGTAFVDAIHADGGNAAIDEAFLDPPTTSEQIVEPEAWPEREEVVEVTAPDADGEVVEEAVAGQFLIHVLTGLSEEEPTPEWDGDNTVLWQDGDQNCLRLAIAGDLDGLETGLGPWAEQVGADLAVEGDVLVVTSCR